jgi:hypothetical protein
LAAAVGDAAVPAGLGGSHGKNGKLLQPKKSGKKLLNFV